MPYKAIAGLIPIGHSIAVASSVFPKKKKGKKITAMDLTKGATTAIIGTSLLRPIAGSVASL